MALQLQIEQGGILEHDAAESKKQGAAVWYKDEGGQHKCILLKLSLNDSAGKKVKRDAKIKCALRYADTGKIVENQSILRVWTEDGRKRGLALKGGLLTVKARVEDVSKNHQGQCFCVEVSCDEEGIESVRTQKVHVRSKRNKRRRASTSPPRTRAPLPQVSEDGLPSCVAEWIQEAVQSLDEMRWRVSGVDYQMRNPNSIIDSLQRKYEKDIAPLLGEDQKRKKPRSVPPMQAPQMSRMRTSAGMTLAILDEAEGQSALHALAGAGSMAPPVLQRGVSSVYTGGPAGDGSGHGEDVPLPPFTETALSREVEQSVQTVLAKKFRPVRDGAVLGFPAYDSQKNLVGLYRDQNGAPVFVPASEAASGLEPADHAAARLAYDRETSNKSDCVHSLATHGALERLKEAALLYCYSKEPWAELDVE